MSFFQKFLCLLSIGSVFDSPLFSNGNLITFCFGAHTSLGSISLIFASIQSLPSAVRVLSLVILFEALKEHVDCKVKQRKVVKVRGEKNHQPLKATSWVCRVADLEGDADTDGGET